MKSIVFATHSYVKVVALHESININNNIFTDIVNSISKRRESRFSRRLARKCREALNKVCRAAASVVVSASKKQKTTTKREDIEAEMVICVDLDDERINASENVFDDIAKAVYKRSIEVMKKPQVRGQDDNNDDSKKKKRPFRICGAMKRLFSKASSVQEGG